MSTFEKAIPVVLKHEGGYVNNPNDPGGATNFGISIRYLLKEATHLLKEFDFDGDGDVDATDMRLMPLEKAIETYKTQWWDKFGYGKITDQDVATKLFDMSVNMGAKQAHKLVQRALCICEKHVVVDGVLGPKSFEAINTVSNSENLLVAMRAVQANFYRSLIAKDSKFKVFEAGWLKRAYS